MTMYTCLVVLLLVLPIVLYVVTSARLSLPKWILVSVVSLPLLAGDALATTVVIMVALNGYPHLPDGMVMIYKVGGVFLLMYLSLFAGFGSRKFAEFTSMPLWLVGSLFVVVAMLSLPPLLCAFSAALLFAFGML